MPPPPPDNNDMLQATLERLQRMLTPQAAREWLHTPNPGLDNHIPVELLDRGDHRQVWALIAAMQEGTFT